MALDFLRETPIHYAWRRLKYWLGYAKWIAKGKPGPVPPQMHKMLTLRRLMAKHKLDVFIETGTLYGETSAFVADTGKKVITIELADNFFKMAKKRFAKCPNVLPLHGDSGVVLPKVVKDLDQPALFWLDGHFSGGETALGVEGTPIAQEIAAVAKHGLASKHVIVVDDALNFETGWENYPPLDKFVALLEKSFPQGRVVVAHNLIVLEPKA